MPSLKQDLLWIALGAVEISVGFAIVALAVQAVLS